MHEHFVSLADLDADRLRWLLGVAAEVRQKPEDFGSALARRVLTSVLDVPATRARLSFHVAMTQLGGSAVFVPAIDLGVAAATAPAAAAAVLAAQADVIVASLESQSGVAALADAATVPVINGGSGLLHPCQAMADLLTLQDELFELGGRKLAWIGPAAPVLHSLLSSAPGLGLDVAVAAPEGRGPAAQVLEAAAAGAAAAGARIECSDDPAAAASGADAIYAAPVGYEGYRVDAALLGGARNGLLLHHLPVGVDPAVVIESASASRLTRQLANRVHVQKAVLLWLMDAV